MTDDTFNILMYSHDTYGLGHIRRTMAIARSLLRDGVNILILTGSPIAGRFEFPHGVDFVRIPGMIKESNAVYMPHSIRVAPEHAMNIRQGIITETARTFDPKLFIVDKVPTGLRGECMPTLRWFKEHRPGTRVVLGLRDILDDAASTRADWERKNFTQVLRELYSEIWIYGDRDIYDPIVEYAIPDDIAAKAVFTGYIPREVLLEGGPPPQDCPPPPNLVPDAAPRKKVLVTTGGGGDGYPILDTYLRMLELNPGQPFRTLMVAGPFVPRDRVDELAARADALGVDFFAFLNNIEQKIAEADLVVSMGGYNTVCEILSLRRMALIVPRETPRLEQRIRAQALQGRGLADYLPWTQLTPADMLRKVTRLLQDQDYFMESLRTFRMTGLDVMRARLDHFLATG